MNRIINIPNIMSVFRMLLIPVFVVFYFSGDFYVALAALFISALTDMIDGMIARKFNMITELGKMLDPLADKLTQATVLICMTIEYNQMLPLAVAVLLKESLMTLGAAIILKQGKPPLSAKWFGKLATAFFYASMLVILVFGKLRGVMADHVVTGIVVISLILTVFAFVRYAIIYLRIMKKETVE